MPDLNVTQAISPAIGQGATLIMLSDRHAYTIVGVTAKTVKATKDIAKRVDNNGFSEAQEYTYETNANAEVETFRLHKDGSYRNKQGIKLSIGQRYSYYDYSF
jgi:hypothetical protein